MTETANSSYVKDHNLRIVLNIIKKKHTISRAEISKITNISRSTISQLVSYLIENNIIEEYKSGESIGGRKPILLRIKPDGPLVIIIEVKDNGKITGRVEDLTGQTKNEIKDRAYNQNELLVKLEGIINKLNIKNKASVVALGLAGIITSEGNILSAVNPHWEDVPVSTYLSEKINIPIIAENATGLAAYGEVKTIGDINTDNLLYIHVDSVVGGSMIINDKFKAGVLGSALEIGHIVIDNNGRQCSCGRRGCLEAEISEPAIYSKMLSDLGDKFIEENHLSEENVFSWLVRNDEKEIAREILKAIAIKLSQGIVNAINLIGPNTIIIKSEINKSCYFWDILLEEVDNNILSLIRGRYKIVKSKLNNNVILNGAAAFARDYFFNQIKLYP